MATIEQRSANSWRVSVRLGVDQGRKFVRRSFSFPPNMPYADQRRRAEMEAAKLTVDVAEGRAVPSQGPMTVADFAGIWLRDHVDPNCSPQTAKQYRALLDGRILPALGDIRLDKLTAYDITKFLNAVRADTSKSSGKPLSPRTVRHHYDTIAYMLNQAVRWSMLAVNPIERVQRPKIKKSRVKALDDDEAVRLLRCLAQEEDLSFRCAVLLALLCGLRLGEVSALNLSDVDWQRCEISINKSRNYAPKEGNYLGPPKSDAGDRIVSLPAGMMALLQECKDWQDGMKALIGDRWRGDGTIVCGWDGTPLHHDTPSKQFRAFAKRNGFEGLTFHGLRHTHATILMAGNMDAVTVARRLGHEDPSTTLRIYAEAIRKRDNESADIMDDLITRSEASPTPDASTPAGPAGPASSASNGPPLAADALPDPVPPPHEAMPPVDVLPPPDAPPPPPPPPPPDADKSPNFPDFGA